MVITKKVTELTITATCTASDFVGGQFNIPHGMPLAPLTFTVTGQTEDTKGVNPDDGTIGSGFIGGANEEFFTASFTDDINPYGVFTFQATGLFVETPPIAE